MPNGRGGSSPLSRTAGTRAERQPVASPLFFRVANSSTLLVAAKQTALQEAVEVNSEVAFHAGDLDPGHDSPEAIESALLQPRTANAVCPDPLEVA